MNNNHEEDYPGYAHWRFVTNKLVERNKPALLKPRRKAVKGQSRGNVSKPFHASKQKMSRFMMKLSSCFFETF